VAEILTLLYIYFGGYFVVMEGRVRFGYRGREKRTLELCFAVAVAGSPD
jgi:hypothetical protein